MSNQTPSPETVIRRAINRALREASTAEPGMIEAYDPQTCTADVQPLLMHVKNGETGERVVTRAPVVSNVPVVQLGGGGSRLTFPVKRGDVCLLLVCSRPIDRWNAIGGEVDPQDTTRHHHLTDAIALVGLSDAAHAKPAHATATVLEGDDIRLGDDTAALLALKQDVDDLRTYVRNQFSAVGGHTHVTPSGPTTTITTVATLGGTPPNVNPPSVVGTTKVKGK